MLSARAPPRSGPTTDEMANVRPNIEVYMGLLRSGTSGSMIMAEPEKMPAAPRPAMARPMMKTTELGAAPQTAEPISKTSIESRKTCFVG